MEKGHYIKIAEELESTDGELVCSKSLSEIFDSIIKEAEEAIDHDKISSIIMGVLDSYGGRNE